MRTERLEAVDITKIYELWKEYSAAISTENIERWITLWCDDGIQMAPDANKCTGKHQFQKLMHAQFDQCHIELSILPEVVYVLGEKAYTHGSSISSKTPKGGEDKAKCQRSGKILTILEKQADGSRKIQVDCLNYNGSKE